VVLEGATAYLRNSGVELAPVPATQCFDAHRAVAVYTESYQTARNGDVLSDPASGRPATVWRLDEKERRGVPVVPSSAHHEPERHLGTQDAAPAPGARSEASPGPDDPRNPLHRDHALYSLLQRRLPDASEDRLVQFTAACHMKGITDKNLGDIYLLEAAGVIQFSLSWPPLPSALVDLNAPMPTPQQAMQQVKSYDQQQAIRQAEFQAQIDQQQGPVLGGPVR
jgi:hypothetical protein